MWTGEGAEHKSHSTSDAAFSSVHTVHFHELLVVPDVRVALETGTCVERYRCSQSELSEESSDVLMQDTTAGTFFILVGSGGKCKAKSFRSTDAVGISVLHVVQVTELA